MSQVSLSDADLPPVAALLESVFAYPRAQYIRAAAQLGIADRLAGGPRSAADLAAELGAEPDALTRLLRAFTVVGLVREQEPGTFAATAQCEALRDNRPLRGFILGFCGPGMSRPMEGLAETAVTGKPAAEATLGMGFWDYYAAYPDESLYYQQMMTYVSTGCVEYLVRLHDFAAAKRIVDVGGGRGPLVTKVLDSAPDATGVIFDRPEVVRPAREIVAECGMEGRVEVIGGDFLAEVPAGGDVYLLKNVACDWDDDSIRKIFANIQAAMSADARLLIIDWVLPEPGKLTVGGSGDPSAGLALSDFSLLTVSSGKIRTLPEFAGLLGQAGLRVERTAALRGTLTNWTLITAVK
jgi:hypothetical protein